MTRPLTITDRDLETLGELAAANKSNAETGWREGWAVPMNCGGSDGSHHSKTLQKLVKLGFVVVQEPRADKPWRSKLGGGAYYKINAAGLARLEQRRLKSEGKK